MALNYVLIKLSVKCFYKFVGGSVNVCSLRRSDDDTIKI